MYFYNIKNFEYKNWAKFLLIAKFIYHNHSKFELIIYV